MKRITCRVHGGTFEIVPKRGRPPVNCTDNNTCTKHPRWAPNDEGPIRTRRTPKGAPIPKATVKRENGRTRVETLPESLRAPVKAPQSVPEPRSEVPASLAKALEAKGLLEAQGWTCHAKRAADGGVEFHASRGIERIAMLIDPNGVVAKQDYSLWDTQKDSANGLPSGARRLPFNPDELSDRELASMLAERTLIWWNRISGKEEKATCPAKVQITHTFNGHDDEVPADRVITFVDMMGGGYRTLRQGALMRMDK